MNYEPFSRYGSKAPNAQYYLPGGFYAAGSHLRVQPPERDYDVQPDLPTTPCPAQAVARTTSPTATVTRRICESLGKIYHRWLGGSTLVGEVVDIIHEPTVTQG